MTDSVAASPVTKLTLQVEGNSLPQLFENAARELLKTFTDPQAVGEVLREKIIVEAGDASSLLQGWVNALLRLACNQHILFKAYRFQEFEAERTGSGKLRAEVRGDLVDPLRHIFRREPIHWWCKQVHLINNSKTIEAQIILEVDNK
jgi:SHS2 domain-containing protein